MKAIILARVSTEEQKDAGNSLPAQVDRLTNYAKLKDFEIGEIFSFDESAYKTKRDEFDKILEYIKEQKEKVAVCFDKVDRFSRNIFDKRVTTLYELAMKDEIELHFASDNLTITSNISATEKFHFGMNLGLAKYYSDAISDSVKRSYEKMRRDGIYPSKPPLGYIRKTDISGSKTIVPDSEKAHIVVKLFELYSTGNYSLETLLQEAIRMGLKTSGGLIPPRSLMENIINDTFYYGIAQSAQHPPYPHKYECLISKDLYDKCKAVKDKKRTNRPKFLSKDFIFKTLLTCKNCGCSMTPEMHKKDSGRIFIYYSCTNAKRICKRGYVSEKKLLEPIYELLGRFKKITNEVQESLVEELRKTTESEIAFHKTQISRIMAEHERLKQKEDALLEAFIEKTITKEIYDKKHQEYYGKIILLNLELEEHNRGNFEYQTTMATVCSVARRAKEIFESSEPNEKRVFLNYLLQNPTVQEKNLEFTIRSPFNLILDWTDSPSRGAHRESNSN
jgi:site-specific DNA recombinase